MTKRFEFKFNDGEYVYFYIIDNETGKEYEYLIDDELLKFLNELSEENEQIRIILSEYMQQIDKLAIENGKLKGQLKIENYPDFLNSLVEKNKQLSEENKRLINILDNERLLKMLDNVANYMQKQNKNIPIEDFVEWWNNITTGGFVNE